MYLIPHMKGELSHSEIVLFDITERAVADFEHQK